MKIEGYGSGLDVLQNPPTWAQARKILEYARVRIPELTAEVNRKTKEANSLHAIRDTVLELIRTGELADE